MKEASHAWMTVQAVHRGTGDISTRHTITHAATIKDDLKVVVDEVIENYGPVTGGLEFLSRNVIPLDTPTHSVMIYIEDAFTEEELVQLGWIDGPQNEKTPPREIETTELDPAIWGGVFSDLANPDPCGRKLGGSLAG